MALTRGYGGRLSGPYWVNAKSDVARDVGDEALLLAGPRRRWLRAIAGPGAQAIETGPHPVTVIVMDDGLQNPGLAKDLTIAVVDGSRGRGLGNGLAMPAGPLRAPLDFQLELTDAIVVNGADAWKLRWPSGCAIALPAPCCARRRSRREHRLAERRARRRLGRHRRAQRFFAMLAALGAESWRRWRFATISGWARTMPAAPAAGAAARRPRW